MKSIKDARSQFRKLFVTYPSLASLKQAARDSKYLERDWPEGKALRSVCWKLFLLLPEYNPSPVWLEFLGDRRETYEKTRDDYLRQLEQGPSSTAFEDAGVDPLADDDENPWKTLRKDEELRQEIIQDIERTYPDTEYFRSPIVQQSMLNILFVYCKINSDISYRQGMHELLAPILWVVESDAIDLKSETNQETQEIDEDEKIFKATLDSSHIESDAFAIFQCMMESAKSWYKLDDNGEKRNGRTFRSGPSSTSPIVEKSRIIHEQLLMSVDAGLAKHLKDLDVLPQVFLIRWIRLMFGREFAFNMVLRLWDGIFAEDKHLGIVDYICVAMLLRIRWQLVKADYSNALMLLLRYPPPSEAHPPITFLADAIYLRENMNAGGGRHIIQKYSGKAPPQIVATATSSATSSRPTTPPPRRRVQSPSSPLSPRSLVGVNVPSLNFEGIVQDIRKNMFERGEKWGVNRALREALSEVRRVSQSSEQQQDDISDGRLNDLEDRCRVLGGLLEVSLGALDEMIQTPGLDIDDRERGKEAVDRVRYVRECLLDSNIDIDQRWLTSISKRRVGSVTSLNKEPQPARRSSSTVKEDMKLPSNTANPLAASSFSSAASTAAEASPSSSSAAARSSSPFRSYPSRKPPPFPSYSPTEALSPSPIPNSTSSTNTPKSPSNIRGNYKSTSSALPPIPADKPLLDKPLPENPPSASVKNSRSRTASSLNAPSYNRSTTQTRRSLAQSQFAWMLGDDPAVRNRSGFVPGENNERRPSDSGLFSDGAGSGKVTPENVFDMGLLGKKTQA